MSEQLRQFADLLIHARAAFNALSPDEQVHHRREQRISFAAGNVALSWPEPPPGALPGETPVEMARAAVGPYPCGKCRVETGAWV